MENRKKLNPDPVTFSIFGEKLRIFFDEDCMVCCALLHAKRQMTLLSGGW